MYGVQFPPVSVATQRAHVINDFNKNLSPGKLSRKEKDIQIRLAASSLITIMQTKTGCRADENAKNDLIHFLTTLKGEDRQIKNRSELFANQRTFDSHLIRLVTLLDSRDALRTLFDILFGGAPEQGSSEANPFHFTAITLAKLKKTFFREKHILPLIDFNLLPLNDVPIPPPPIELFNPDFFHQFLQEGNVLPVQPLRRMSF